jgi:agmatine/peptidylarginine deiminase
MSKTAARVRATFLILALGVAAAPQSPAQRANQSDKPAPDPRLQELIDARKDEHWDFLATQLKLTQPPRSQPIRALPEWHPAGGVILTLDSDYISSFRLNHLLRTEGRWAEIAKREPAAMRYVITSVCNALYSAQAVAADPDWRNKAFTASLNEICKWVPASERRAMPEAASSPQTAEYWLISLSYLLGGEALAGASEGGSLLAKLSYAHTFLQIVKGLAPHTKVLILLKGREQNEDSLYDGIALIKNFPGGGELLSSKNVQFVQIGVSSKWVRDYGPIFIRGADGQILCVDPRYETTRTSLEEKRRAAEQRRQQSDMVKGLVQALSKNDPEAGKAAQAYANESANYRDRLYDDVSPSLLAARLRQRSGNVLRPYPLNVVRPPLALDGGDFFTDGNGIGFTSIATLQLNGGNQEQLNEVFREYFGVKDVVYLNPLPGRTVPHIDMFFKVVSPELILLGKFDDIGRDKQDMALQTEARRVLSYNLTVLKNFYEGRRVKVNVVAAETDSLLKNAVNIVLVPMPNLRRPAREGTATLDREDATLAKQYEEHTKGADDALRRSNALGGALASIQENLKEMADAAVKLQSSSAAKSVDLERLRELAARAAAGFRTLYADYGADAKTFDWQGSYQRLLDLSTYVNTRKGASGRNLKSGERRELESYLLAASGVLQAVASALQPVSTQSMETYKRHVAEQELLSANHQRVLAKRTLIEQLDEYHYDVYLTYLNSLQVRTGRANLLFVPTYTGTGALEKRVLDIFRRVYTRAYGSVTVVPVESDYIIRQLGTIHCLTQTLPAEVDVFDDDWNFRSKLNVK